MQSETEPAVGASIKGRILDVNKKDAIVDLTLKKDLLAGAPEPGKSPKGLKVHLLKSQNYISLTSLWCICCPVHCSISFYLPQKDNAAT